MVLSYDPRASAELIASSNLTHWWCDSLLDPDIKFGEKLGVFSGKFSQNARQACGLDLATATLIARALDTKSLEDMATRYRMKREETLEKLEAVLNPVRLKHIVHILALLNDDKLQRKVSVPA